MQGNGPNRLRARWAALTVATLLAVLAPVTAASATPATASPTPTPTPTPTSDSPGIGLQIGNLKINLGLPLNIGGVLQIGDGTPTSTPSSTTSSPTPTTSPPPSSVSPTSARPTPTRTTTRPSATSGPPHGGFGPPPVGPAPGSRQQHNPHHRTTAPKPEPSHDVAHGRLVLTRALLSANGTVLLIAVLVILALAVAIFVRLSGRRGGHQA
jgi:hypothetical protein